MLERFIKINSLLRAIIRLLVHLMEYGSHKNKSNINTGALKLKWRSPRVLRTDEWAYLFATFSPFYIPGSTCDVTANFHPSYLVKNFMQGYMGKTIESVVSTTTPTLLMFSTLRNELTGGRKKTYRQLGGHESRIYVQMPLIYESRAQQATCRPHANPVARK